MNNIAIIGTGAYGLSIGILLANNGYKVNMWIESSEKADYLNNNKANNNILPTITIPNAIKFYNDYKEVLNNTQVVFIATSAKFISNVTKDMQPYINNKMHYCILSKGIEQNSCMFVTEVFKQNIITKQLAVISGPSFAIDVANLNPIGLSIATNNKKTFEIFNKVLKCNTLKLRHTKDIIGVELCGSIKNIIAIASGIIEGLGYTESTRSLLITESLHDIKELIYALGGNKKTILSYAGVGDLLLTCTSTKSRNYSYGILIGKKENNKAKEFEENNTVEGYYTLKSIHLLIKRKKVSIPIINLIYRIVINEEDPSKLIEFLIQKN